MLRMFFILKLYNQVKNINIDVLDNRYFGRHVYKQHSNCNNIKHVGDYS